MHACGIISEYNPFHHGHRYQIEQTCRIHPGSLILCAMSGSFVQRGEPAVFDKWTRAQCAVLGGADAVIELPLLTAVQSAEGFAAGGIKLLYALGATHLSFGSETDDIRALSQTAATLSRETRAFKRELRRHLASGMSFPKARMLAAFADAPDELHMPNAILAVEYLKAINRQRAGITPIAIKRVGEGYHSKDYTTAHSSATAIRAALRDGQMDDASASMPDAAATHMREQMDAGLTPVFPDAFDQTLLFRLRTGGISYIKTLHDVSEGLENRIYEAAKTAVTRAELIEKIKTKRYTYTRISRILLYALLGITRDVVKRYNRQKPKYARVLAVKNGEVLSKLNDISRVPIIAGAVANTAYSAMDIAATGAYALTQHAAPFNAASRDYTQRLITLL